MAFIVFVYRSLFDRYEWFIDDFQFILADKLFYWFMIGALFGIIAIGMIFEGEFLLGLRNISRELADAEKKILKPEKTKTTTRKRK